jgi:hypothetical protein
MPLRRFWPKFKEVIVFRCIKIGLKSWRTRSKLRENISSDDIKRRDIYFWLREKPIFRTFQPLCPRYILDRHSSDTWFGQICLLMKPRAYLCYYDLHLISWINYFQVS